MPEERDYGTYRLFAAVTIIAAFLLGWQYFYEGPKQQKSVLRLENITKTQDKQSVNVEADAPQIAIQAENKVNDDNNLPRTVVSFSNKRIRGEINLNGGIIDSLTLIDYKDNVEGEEKLTLLTPDKARPYSVSFGWLPRFGVEKDELPNAKTKWTTDRSSVSSGETVTLTAVKGKMTFKIKISLDNDYMFNIQQEIINDRNRDAQVSSYARIKRWIDPKHNYGSDSHEGLIGVFDGSFKEFTYTDAMKNPVSYQQQADGWIGMGDKYWLTALLPQQGDYVVVSDNVQKTNGDVIGFNIVYSDSNVNAGESAKTEIKLFSGAKDVVILDNYSKQNNIRLFDRAIDFGFFYFMAKPVLLFLRWINNYTLNYGISIIIMTIIIRVLLLPLANKSYKAMAKLKVLGPKMTAIKEKYKDDKASLNREIVNIYKQEKINPISGITPLLLQIPIFFALYKVLYVSIEMRHSPFFGWITDLSAPDMTSIFNLFGLLPYSVPKFLLVGVLPILMGVTIWVQQKVSSTGTIQDPTQAKIMNYLPIFLTFIFAGFPAGLMIYWIAGNIFGITQQYVILRLNRRK